MNKEYHRNKILWRLFIDLSLIKRKQHHYAMADRYALEANKYHKLIDYQLHTKYGVDYYTLNNGYQSKLD